MRIRQDHLPSLTCHYSRDIVAYFVMRYLQSLSKLLITNNNKISNFLLFFEYLCRDDFLKYVYLFKMRIIFHYK